MKNKFALSFGISLIIVGLLNIFFDTNGIILFGLSVSTLMFSILNIVISWFKFDKKKWADYIYIIPFVILLSIFCYSNSLAEYNLVQKIVNGKTLNVLTFISFGSLFISEYMNYRKDIENEKIRNMAIIVEVYDYSNLVLKTLNDYYDSLIKNKIVLDKDSVHFTEQIRKICIAKSEKCDIEMALLKTDKDYYSLDDVAKAYTDNNDTLSSIRKKIDIVMKKKSTSNKKTKK